MSEKLNIRYNYSLNNTAYNNVRIVICKQNFINVMSHCLKPQLEYYPSKMIGLHTKVFVIKIRICLLFKGGTYLLFVNKFINDNNNCDLCMCNHLYQ